MTLLEIKTAVDSGNMVCWKNKGYTVVKAKGMYYIKHQSGACIGLTWADGVTLNGDESDFYVSNGGTR